MRDDVDELRDSIRQHFKQQARRDRRDRILHLAFVGARAFIVGAAIAFLLLVATGKVIITEAPPANHTEN